MMLFATLRAVPITILFASGAVAAGDRPSIEPRTATDQELAVCAVCGPLEGAGFEPVKARATLRGVSYAFCSLECKVKFLKDPAKYLSTDLGMPAPSFSLPLFGGAGALSLSSLRGDVVLLDFWGTFCAPCVKALPELQAMHERFRARGFGVVGVTVDERPEMARRALEKAKVTYPVLQATPETWSAFKVNSLPSLVLVGRDGTILKRFGGATPHAEIAAEVEKALGASASAARAER